MSSQLKQLIFSAYIFIFTAFLSSQLGKHFFFSFSYLSGVRIDYLAPTLYLTDILSFPLIILFLFRVTRNAKRSYNTFPISSSIFLFICFLISINYFFSLSKPLWMYNALRIIQWSSIVYFFSRYAKRKNVFSAAIFGLFLGGLLELILSLLQLSSRHSIQGFWYYLGERSFSIFTPGIAKAYFLGHEFLRPYGTFSHPNSLAGFYLLLYAFILTQKRMTNIFLRTILLTLFSFLIFISFSRTAIIIYVIINLLFFFHHAFSCRLCLFAKLVTGCILIFFALNISGDLQSMAKRNDFAQKAVAIIAEKPFSGVGIGSYLIAQHEFPQKFSPFFEQPVHNIFLLTVAQLGIPLFILSLTLINRYIRVVLTSSQFFIPLLVIFLTGSMDHYWLTLQQNVLLTAVVFGMIKAYETTAS